MEYLATTFRFVTLNCQTLSSELQQTELSRLLRYLSTPFAALHETRTRGWPVISIENYTIYCGDVNERKVVGCATAVRNDYDNQWKNMAQRRLDASSYECGVAEDANYGSKVFIHLWIPLTARRHKHAFYDELNALMSKIPN
ncbi:hypothetical protein RB195_024529 [Necator americanus]|uniref:Uncharacterized protein n=1 Tax=Necator americanus TaxID=51031 RepID=A0ABR1ENP5_NECAM